MKDWVVKIRSKRGRTLAFGMLLEDDDKIIDVAYEKAEKSKREREE